MSCITCFQAFGSSRKPICPSCAQATLHDPRVNQAVTLVSREKAHAHVEAIFRPGNDGVLASLPEDADWDAITQGMKSHWAEKTYAEQQATENRIDLIARRALELKAEIEGYKQSMERERASHDQRRHELQECRKRLQNQTAMDSIQSAVRKVHSRHVKVQSKIVDARIVLCYQAASLAGLQRHRNPDGKSDYRLAFAPLYDLRNLGKMDAKDDSETRDKLKAKSTGPEPHEVYSASLEHICRLVSICCHYLSIRLPAEIVLPQQGSTRPMIYPERSSYKPRDARHTPSNNSSPSASRVTDRAAAMPRPRILFLDRPINQLSKEDPKAFLFFLEGVMLLAWDVAWLCKTQGMENVNIFEDVCGLGRNLYQLLISSSSSAGRPALDRRASSARANDEKAHPVTLNSSPGLGMFTHGSAAHALHGAQGLEIMRTWKLSSPTVLTRLVDKLSKHITSELADQEWGMLSEGEWEEQREDEQAVLVGGSRKTSGTAVAANSAVMSVMTVAPTQETGTVSGNGTKAKGTSGWTKVRDRGNE